jgi:hypothetical protein
VTAIVVRQTFLNSLIQWPLSQRLANTTESTSSYIQVHVQTRFSFKSPITNLASHNRRPRNLVRCTIALRLPILIVDAQQDTRVALSICTREANRRASLASAAADIDLRASHVELYTLRFGSGVQCDDFSAEEVLTRLL